MNSGSSAPFTSAAAIVVFMLRRASPWARRIAPVHIIKTVSGRLGATISRNPDASRAVSPSAPSSATSASDVAQTPQPTRNPTPAAQARALVAHSLARSISPAPQARLTSAPTAMANPMPIEVVKNRMEVA